MTRLLYHTKALMQRLVQIENVLSKNFSNAFRLIKRFVPTQRTNGQPSLLEISLSLFTPISK